MISFDRFTTLYVPHEDRITLVAESKQEGVVRLWLIRPLIDKLVLALAQTMKPKTGNREYADVMDAFAQSSAERNFEPSPPVIFVPDTVREQQATAASEGQVVSEPLRPASSAQGFSANEWLVGEISLTIQKSGGYALTFAGAGDRKAKCAFSEERLRQWLGILRRVCLKARWTNPDWPDWMKEPEKVEASPTSLH